jgi:hypothetical protein
MCGTEWIHATTSGRKQGPGANNQGRNARAHPKHSSAFSAQMCGAGGPLNGDSIAGERTVAPISTRHTRCNLDTPCFCMRQVFEGIKLVAILPAHAQAAPQPGDIDKLMVGACGRRGRGGGRGRRQLRKVGLAVEWGSQRRLSRVKCCSAHTMVSKPWVKCFRLVLPAAAAADAAAAATAAAAAGR